MTAVSAVPPKTSPSLGVPNVAAEPFETTIVRRDARRATVYLQGELDLATAPNVTAALTDLLTGGYRFLRLDVSRLSFIDCAGLGVLLRAHHAVLAARGTLILTGIGPRIARLLALTDLHTTLFIAENPDPDPDSVQAERAMPRQLRELAR
jgi:anti-anti-sigma factor